MELSPYRFCGERDKRGSRRSAEAMTGRGVSGSLLPFYLVCDASESMGVDGKIDAVNQILPELQDAVLLNPVVADKTRFAVMAFSDHARLELPLSNLADQQAVGVMPHLQAAGRTSFDAAFRALDDRLPLDAAQLRADGFDVHRPAIFFFSDGYPTDPPTQWRQALKELVSSQSPHRPNIVSFGIGNADPETMCKVATLRCYMASDEISPAKAISEFATYLVRSVIASGTAGQLQLPPEAPHGLIDVDVLELD